MRFCQWKHHMKDQIIVQILLHGKGGEPKCSDRTEPIINNKL